MWHRGLQSRQMGRRKYTPQRALEVPGERLTFTDLSLHLSPIISLRKPLAAHLLENTPHRLSEYPGALSFNKTCRS